MLGFAAPELLFAKEKNSHFAREAIKVVPG